MSKFTFRTNAFLTISLSILLSLAGNLRANDTLTVTYATPMSAGQHVLNTCVSNPDTLTLKWGPAADTASFTIVIDLYPSLILNSTFIGLPPNTDSFLTSRNFDTATGVLTLHYFLPVCGSPRNIHPVIFSITPSCSNIPTNVFSTIISITPGASFLGAVVLNGGSSTPPLNFSSYLHYPNISQASSATVSTPISAFPVVPNVFSLPYKNASTNTNYWDSLQIDESFPAHIRITKIQIKIGNNPLQLVDSNLAGIQFPFTTPDTFFIPSEDTFRIFQTVSIDSNTCIQNQAYSSEVYLRWGCSTTLCATTVPNNVILSSTDAPQIQISRILPSESPIPSPHWIPRSIPASDTVSTDSVVWEANCLGSATDSTKWSFLIRNSGTGLADSVVIYLDREVANVLDTSYTYVQSRSISYTKSDTFAASVTKINDTVSRCTSDSALYKYALTIPILRPGEYVVLNFSTARCCPDSIHFNTSINFNTWELYSQCRDNCGNLIYNTTVAQRTTDSIAGLPTNVYPTNTIASGYPYISYEQFGLGSTPDLGLKQYFQQTVTDLSIPNGDSCTSDTPVVFTLENRNFTTQVNGTYDLDPMLFCQSGYMLKYLSGTDTLKRLVGINPRGKIIIRLLSDAYGTNIKFPHLLGSSYPVSITSSTGTSWPAYSIATGIVVDNFSGVDVIFDLATLNDSTSEDFRDFFQHSIDSFGIQACCHGPHPNPFIKVQTFFIPDLGCSSACMIPLCEQEFELFLHCPGCVIPGAITRTSTLWRTNLGYKDSNNDGIPDSTNSSLPPVPVRIASNLSNYTQPINIIGSIAGDTVQSFTKMHIQPGVDGSGFSLATWQNYWHGHTWSMGLGATPLLSDLFFEQNIINGDQVGLTCIGGSVTYNTGTPVAIPSTAFSVLSGNSIFMCHITDTLLSIPTTGFQESDSFQFTLTYLIGSNPTTTEHLQGANYIYLMSNSDSLYTITPQTNLAGMDSVVPDLVAADSGYYTGSSCAPCAAVSPDKLGLFICEACGSSHYTYPIVQQYLAEWKDNGGCSKELTVQVLSMVNADFNNIFYNEYRPMPDVNLSNGVGHGLTLTNGVSPFLTHIPNYASYLFSPTPANAIETFAPNYSNSLQTTYMDASVDSINLIPADTFSDWVIDTTRTAFTPPSPLFNISSGHFNINPPQPAVAQQDTFAYGGHAYSGLISGDEYFEELLHFNVEQRCKNTTPDSTPIGPSDVYAIVSSNISIDYSRAAVDSHMICLPNAVELITPRPEVAAHFVNSPRYDANFIDFTLVVYFTDPSNVPFPNLTFYFDAPHGVVPGIPTNMHLQCVSQDVNFASGNCITGSLIVGTSDYIRYTLPALHNMVEGSDTMYFRFEIDSCPIVNLSLHDTVFYAWTCDSSELDKLPAIPLNTCFSDSPNYVVALATPPTVALTVVPTTPTVDVLSGCDSIALSFCISSQQVGGFGNLVAQISLPPDATIDSLASPLSPSYRLVPGGDTGRVPIVSPVLVSDTNWNVWQLNMDSITAFSANSITGVNGLTNVFDTLCVYFIVKTDCRFLAPGSIFTFPMKLYGNKYCDIGGPRDSLSATGFTMYQAPTSSCSFRIVNPGLDCTNHLLFRDTGSASTPYITVFDSTHHAIASGFHSALGTYRSDSVLAIGSYQLVLINADDSCADAYNFAVTQMLAVDSVRSSTSCLISGGAITLHIKGGNPISSSAYHFSWSSGGPVDSATQAPDSAGTYTQSGGANYTITGLSGGVYSITVSDKNGCTVTVSESVDTVHPILTHDSISAINCMTLNRSGGDSATIFLRPSGGTAPYQFSWNGVSWSTVADTTGLSMGVYEFSVQDARGCTAATNDTIRAYVPISIMVADTAITCHGGHTAITVTASGGNDVDSVRMNSGAYYGMLHAFPGVGGGSDTIWVKDTSGCTASLITTINNPAAVVINSIYQAGIQCMGGLDSLVINASGGTGSLLYELNEDTFRTSNIFRNIGAGHDTIYVKDANGCLATRYDTIDSPTAYLTISSVTVTPAIPCYGDTTSLTVTVIGNTGTVSYKLNAGGTWVAGGNIIHGVGARIDTIWVKDSFCMVSFIKTVTQPTALLITVSSYTAGEEICNSSGYIDATSSGGTTPYKYRWSTGLTGVGAIDNISNLPPGTATLTVTDANGCTASIYRRDTLINTCGTSCCKSLGSLPLDTLVTSTQFLYLVQHSGYCPTCVSGNNLNNFPDTITVNTVITLDTDLYVYNCNLNFCGNGKIRVTAGHHLSIDSSTLVGCSAYMWKGILVDSSTSQVYISQSIIRDAEIGVNFTSPASANIQNSTFLNDSIGIKLSSPTNDFWTMPNQFRVAGNEFTCDSATMKKRLLDGITPLYTDMGIFISRINATTPVTIGDTSAAHNYFHFIRCAIYDSLASLVAVNNYIENLKTSPTATYHYRGIAIATNTPIASLSPTYTLQVGTGTGAGLNFFGNTYRAVDAWGSTVSMVIDSNTFQSSASRNTDIAINSNQLSSNISIKNNVITSNYVSPDSTAILLQNCKYSTITVNSNTIDLFHTVSRGTTTHVTAYQTKAIFVNGFTTSASGGVNITNNWIGPVQTGIITYSTTGNVRIWSNQIYLYPSSWGTSSYWVGISSTADQNMSIKDNYINGDYYDVRSAMPNPISTSSDSGVLIGINIANLAATDTIGCNILTNTHWSIATIGTNSGQIIKNNNMDSTIDGIIIYNGGHVGNQGTPTSPNDNYWDTIGCQHELGVYNTIGAGQTFYLRNPPGTSYYPSQTTPEDIQGFFSTPMGLSPLTDTNAIATCDTPVLISPDLRRLAANYDIPYFESIANGTLLFASDSIDNLEWAREHLVTFVNDHPDILDMSQVISNFTNTNTAAYPQLMLIHNSMRIDTGSALQNDSVNNANAVPEDVNEQNLQTANALYMNYLAKGNINMDSADLVTLISIADQCSLPGGPGVLLARSMYWIVTNNANAQFYDLCSDNTRSLRANHSDSAENNSTTKENYFFKLYPNLINRNGAFYVQTSESGEIAFYNILGQTLFTSPLVIELNTFNCSQLNCQTDVVLYKAKLANGKTENGKIVTIK